MTKYYNISGKVYRFDNVEMQAGCLMGYCKAENKYAWLDPNGVQFENERRMSAYEVSSEAQFPYGCTMWGGQIRDALPHGARYYLRQLLVELISPIP